MADSDDLNALIGGAKNLKGFDLVGANLSGLLLPDRDFSGASLYKVAFNKSTLDGSILSNSTLMDVSFIEASLRDIRLNGVALTDCFFNYSDLSSSDFSFTAFLGCDFSYADLRGCSFANSRFDNACRLADCLIDEATDFEGATVSRKLSKNEIFAHYDWVGGQLTRQIVITAVPPTPSVTEAGYRLRRAISAAEEHTNSALRHLQDDPLSSGMGHNSSAVLLAPNGQLLEEIHRALVDLREEIRKPIPNSKVLEDSSGRLTSAAGAVGLWLAQKGDLFADEFVKNLGAEAAKLLTRLALLATMLTSVGLVLKELAPLLPQ